MSSEQGAGRAGFYPGTTPVLHRGVIVADTLCNNVLQNSTLLYFTSSS